MRRAARHQLKRQPDKKSYIDPERTERNRVLIGTSLNIMKDVEAFLETCARSSHKSAPDIAVATIILGASPEYFRPENQEPGDEDPERLEAWIESTVAWIKQTFGDGAVNAIVNLDETTPHIHLAVVSTYQKKPRLPGRKQRGETDEEFQARRRAALEHPGVRTLSWSSSPIFGRPDAFTPLRRSYAEAMAPLGLEYALASYDPKARAKARAFKEWMDDRARELDDVEAALVRQRIIEAECRAIDQERNEQRAAETRARDAELERREAEQARRADQLARESAAFAKRRAVEVECFAIDRERAAMHRDAARDEVHAAKTTAAGIVDAAKAAAETTARRAEEEARRRRVVAAAEEARRERTLARRRAAEDECAAIDRERDRRRVDGLHRQVAAARAEAEAVRQNAQDEARRIRQGAEREAATSEDAGRLTQTAASNLDKAVTAALKGTHDEPITREHVKDEARFRVLCEHAPQGRPTWGFWYCFWSLNDARTGAPLFLPERVRSAFEQAFDAVAGLARRMAALVRREAELEQERQVWDAGRETRERTLAETREAEGRLAERRAAAMDAEARRDAAEREVVSLREEAATAKGVVVDLKRYLPALEALRGWERRRIEIEQAAEQAALEARAPADRVAAREWLRPRLGLARRWIAACELHEPRYVDPQSIAWQRIHSDVAGRTIDLVGSLDRVPNGRHDRDGFPKPLPSGGETVEQAAAIIRSSRIAYDGVEFTDGRAYRGPDGSWNSLINVPTQVIECARDMLERTAAGLRRLGILQTVPEPPAEAAPLLELPPAESDVVRDALDRLRDDDLPPPGPRI